MSMDCKSKANSNLSPSQKKHLVRFAMMSRAGMSGENPVESLCREMDSA